MAVGDRSSKTARRQFLGGLVASLVTALVAPAVAKRRAIDGWRRQERYDERLAAIAHDLGPDFTAAQFRDRLDNGRKVAIQILEFFDRHGITLRRGDLRRPVPQKLDQNGPPPG